ncbi:MAG: ABC transporter substrate-binding protein [Planctomycetes bacterium]|nr:ABC transporter substrate-binding protein [Planctomycetota bacterium]
MWKPHQPEAWDRLFKEFHDAHPDIRVKTEIGPHSATEFHTILTTKLRAKDESIDVFLIDVIWPAEFAKAGYLEPLDDVIPEAERRDFFSAPIEANTVDGKLMAAPFNIDAGSLYYRKDLLDQYGYKPPQTWGELVAQAKKIVEGEKEPGLAGYTGQFDKYEGLVCNMLEFIRGNGGRMTADDGSLALDDPKSAEAIEFVREKLIGDVAPKSVLNQREPQSRGVFLQGESVFHRNWPETWKIVNDAGQSKVAGKVGLAPLPKFEGGRAVATLGGWQLAVAAHSTKKQAAKTFVKYLTSFDTQKKLTLWTSQTHSRKTVMEDSEVLAAFPHFKDLTQVLEAATPRPRLANYHEVSDRLQRELYERISRAPEERGGSGLGWIPPILGIGVLAALVFLVARRR